MADDRIILDYTARDFLSIRSSLVGLAQGLMPDWKTAGEPGDFGTLLLELYAYSGDVMNFYIDRLASEAFLGTAVRRQSVLYLADMFGYSPVGQRAATVPVTFSWTLQTAPTIYEYGVKDASASISNGIASLVLTTTSGIGFRLAVDQTVTITDVGFTYDGVFNIMSAEPNEAGDELTITYSVEGREELAPNADLSTAEVTTGQTIIIPAGTVVASGGGLNAEATYFETSSQAILEPSLTFGDGDQVVEVTVSAVEGRTVPPTKIGVSRGVPSAEYAIPQPGVVDGSVTVYTVEGGEPVYWTPIPKMSLASKTQSAFSTYVDDENVTHVTFGDNAAGRVPPINAPIYIGYRYGVGAAANSLPVNSITQILSYDWASSNNVKVTNPTPPYRGTDVESVASMRSSIPRANALRQRAVTVEDFAHLAKQVPMVAKAVSYGTNYTSIYVRVASSSASVGYISRGVTAGLVVNNMVTLSLDGGVTGLAEGSKFYLPQDGVFDVPKGEYTAHRVWAAKDPVPIVGLEHTSDGETSLDDVATFYTADVHGLRTGQPVTLSFGDSGTEAAFGGSYLVQSVDNGDPDADILPSFTVLVADYDGPPDLSVTPADPPVPIGEAAVIPGLSFPYTTANDIAEGITGKSVKFLDSDMGALIASVEGYLSDKKLAGSVVYAEPVVWTGAHVELTVHVHSLYNRSAVTTAVQSAVEEVFSFDAVDFGQRISVGEVYRSALAVDGVDYVTITAMHPTFALTRENDTDLVDLGEWAATEEYTLNDIVEECRLKYRCLVAHESTSSFDDDLAAGNWEVWPEVQDIATPPYNLPRSDSVTVSGTGGLVNT